MYKKIIILGGSCSGKSTLANRISSYTKYTAYHLDNLFLDSKWEKLDKKEREEISKQFLSKETGVIDGNYSDILPERINWADLIIFIDIPTRVRLYRWLKRTIRVKLGLGDRYGKPDGASDKLNLSFLSWIYHWNKTHRNKLFSMFDSAKDKKVIIINRPKELDIENLLK